jgi:hypothetical protein
VDGTSHDFRSTTRQNFHAGWLVNENRLQHGRREESQRESPLQLSDTFELANMWTMTVWRCGTRSWSGCGSTKLYEYQRIECKRDLVAACNEKMQVKVANYLENRTPERMRELEEMPYSEFLRTTEWKQMSWLVLQLRKTCAHCGAPAKEVHHKTYKFGRLYPEALEAVCHNCHEVLHGASF